MSEARNGEQKGCKYLYSEIIWSDEMSPSSISQQFNWSHQLIFLKNVHFWRFRSLYDLEGIPTMSVEQETVFVERDTALFIL